MAQAGFGYDVPRAMAAARVLANNPDDLAKVFTIIESLSGNTLGRTVKRCLASEGGRRLLSEQPDIVKVLADRAALARLPEGSLGRAYLAFVESENISAEGLIAAAKEGRTGKQLPAPLGYMHCRMRDTHDLWHAVTGYRGDILGETALLAFLLAQTGNPAIALIVGIGLVRLRDHAEMRRLVMDGFRRGRKAAWLPAQEWESMLALPVEEVRARLGIDAPPVYEPLRTAMLRAERMAA